MSHKFGRYIKMRRSSIRLLVAIVLLTLLAQTLAADRTFRPARSRKVPVPEAHKQRIAGRLAASYGIGPFEPSLAMKESADFLLTPALLVQEAICDDIIITYPTE
jgi:hypothetical protein